MNTYMSLGALSSEAFGTIEIVDKFNRLFDMFNSLLPQNPNKFKNAFDGSEFQNKFLIEMLEFLKTIKSIGQKWERYHQKIKVYKLLENHYK